jgi:DNA polymerase IV (DinB-like DNA polymerase)
MHVDLDYFFAQCEEQRQPDLRTKPVVVCVFSGRTNDSGAVSTANYRARSFGVRSGMPIFQAKRILHNEDPAFLPVDKEYYQNVSDRIMTIVRSYSDAFEQVGIDEAFLDVTARTSGDFSKAAEYAAVIKKRILDEVGITCSVGIAPNKLVAKIASDHRKPDGLTSVPPNSVSEFLAPLEVRKLVGVGKKTETILVSVGVKTIGDLRARSTEQLVEHFGRSFGAYLYDAARGIDGEPVVEREGREQISRIVTLKQNSHYLEEIFPEIEKLLDDVVAKAATDRLSFRTVSVIAVMEDLSVHSRSQSFDAPISATESARKACRILLQNLLGETSKSIRRVGVRLSTLVPPKERGQSSLSEFVA